MHINIPFESKIKQKNRRTQLKNSIHDTHTLKLFSPQRGYSFYSDYFMINLHCYAAILALFHRKGADRAHRPMWATDLLPQLNDKFKNISTHFIMPVRAASHTWINKHLNTADTINRGSQEEANGHIRQEELSSSRIQDIRQVNRDLIHDDTYLYVGWRLLIKAPTLQELDAAVREINRQYKDHTDSIYAHAYDGQEYDELHNILRPANVQVGAPNYMFTSSELSGAYNLVSQGINDPLGQYMGYMIGDFNQSAVNWDIDNFEHSNHVVIGANQPAETRTPTKFPDNTHGSDMWGVSLAQSVLSHNHRVVHFVLNDSKIDNIGENLNNCTLTLTDGKHIPLSTTVGMNQGAINPFEMFGNPDKISPSDELAIFPAHSLKIRLMAKAMSNNLNDVDLERNLSQLLEDFYIDQGMWRHDAKDHVSELRIIGIPHNQVPLLQKFNAYLDNAYDVYKSRDRLMADSIVRLQAVFHPMLTENGDLFDRFTNNTVDLAKSSPQVIYDFSSIMRRGRSIAMAQFINSLTYAVDQLHANDLVEIHGTELLTHDPVIRQYINNVLIGLMRRRIHVAYIYDSVDSMLADIDFNHFGTAGWVLSGTMSQAQINKYQQVLQQQLPPMLTTNIQHPDNKTYYLRRGTHNILFVADPTIKLSNKFAYYK